MTRPRRPNEPSSYEPQPQIDPSLRHRFEVIRSVLGQHTTISEGARKLEIARVNMQTLVHRAEAAILGAMAPRPTGPVPKSDEQKQLEARIEKLERENAKLKTQLQAADDMMGAAGEIIRSLRGLPPTKTQRSQPSSRPSFLTPTDDEDP